MVKAILFDFYGVFLPDSYNAWLAKNNLRREGVFADCITLFDRGVISEEVFFEQLSAAAGYHVDRAAIDAATAAMLNTPLVALVHELKPHYTIGLLSNASARLRTKLDALELTPLFDTILISSEIGYVKPSQEAFMAAIRGLGVLAGEILFIDDNAKNIEAARTCGLQTIHYTSVAELHKALSAHNVL